MTQIKKYPFIYDLFAGFLTFTILILSNVLSRGENPYLKISGVIILVFTALFWILPFIHLKKYGEVEKGHPYYDTNCIANRGIYRLVRHPQYLAYILLVIGFTLISQNWIIMIIAVITISLFYYHTLLEEKVLKDKFQKEYIAYCHNVPRFNIILGIISRLRSK
jgi:protein-S-isoprenylcysteine O-methyltransferase Ste14